MPDRTRRHRTDTYEHTAAGLLTMRSDLLKEATTIRDRLAEIKNNLDAIDLVLRSLGHDGDLDAEMPTMKRDRIFGHGELTRRILDALREATGPLSSREIGALTLAAIGQDPDDSRLLAYHTNRVSKALRPLKADGLVRPVGDLPGRVRWVLVQ